MVLSYPAEIVHQKALRGTAHTIWSAATTVVSRLT